MPTGTIKFFSAPKRFGFITSDEDGKDIFLPLATLTEAGLTNLPLGQRVSFEVQPDKKGPKAIKLALIETAHPPRPVKAPSAPTPALVNPSRLTLYYDPGNEDAIKALAALRATGREYTLVDYIDSPPSRDKLIAISLLLRETDQSLVRKYDPLFRDLRLDDRFISQNELWDGVLEHPSLINGPILATVSRARICRSEEDIAAFLEGKAPIRATGRVVSMPAFKSPAIAPVERPLASADKLKKLPAKTVGKGTTAKKELGTIRSPKPKAEPSESLVEKSPKAESKLKGKPKVRSKLSKSVSKTPAKAKAKPLTKPKSRAAKKRRK